MTVEFSRHPTRYVSSQVEIKTTEELSDGVTRETSLNSKLNLVDLAGSERSKKTGASGSTLKEGSSINKWVTLRLTSCFVFYYPEFVTTVLLRGRHILATGGATQVRQDDVATIARYSNSIRNPVA